jgi:hypothetical protein
MCVCLVRMRVRVRPGFLITCVIPQQHRPLEKQISLLSNVWMADLPAPSNALIYLTPEYHIYMLKKKIICDWYFWKNLIRIVPEFGMQAVCVRHFLVLTMFGAEKCVCCPWVIRLLYNTHGWNDYCNNKKNYDCWCECLLIDSVFLYSSQSEF